MGKTGFLILCLVLSPLSAQSANFQAYTAYLDNVEDDDEPISVFKTPGQNWKHCEREFDKVTKREKCKDAVGWPDRDSNIRVIGPAKLHKTIDPVTDDTVTEKYTEIEFSYRRKGADGKIYNQKGTGFIESFYLSKKPTSGFYSPLNSEKEICKRKDYPEPAIKKIEDFAKDLGKSVENLSIAQQAEMLSSVVGFCPLKPPTKLPAPLPSGSPYDALIKTTIRSNKTPKLYNEKGKRITNDDVIAIDALARTMYGEMARCYRKGLQYPLAVARMVVNRAESIGRHKEFIKPPQLDDKPDIAKVSTSASQFSLWQKTMKKNGVDLPNGPLHHALCPPIEKGKPFWKSGQASGMESDIWKNTIRIATEAVLHPVGFKKRTEAVNGFFYTSDMAHLKDDKKRKPFFRKMDREFPSIEGRQISDGKCVEVWKEKSEDIPQSRGLAGKKVVSAEIKVRTDAAPVAKPAERPSKKRNKK